MQLSRRTFLQGVSAAAVAASVPSISVSHIDVIDALHPTNYALDLWSSEVAMVLKDICGIPLELLGERDADHRHRQGERP